jgi:hypothetical protein
MQQGISGIPITKKKQIKRRECFQLVFCELSLVVHSNLSNPMIASARERKKCRGRRERADSRCSAAWMDGWRWAGGREGGGDHQYGPCCARTS